MIYATNSVAAMKKSFIDRIFPNSPGNTRYQYDYDEPVPPSPPRCPPRILLQDSVASSSRSRNGSPASNRHLTQSLSSTLIRHNDPFLPVERASKDLERTLQSLLDAQSKGLSAGVGTDPAGDPSSVDSPTPTPSITTSPRSVSGLRTVPIRQPKKREVTLRDARHGLSRSMAEFAALKDYELTLIEREAVARNNALKQTSDLENREHMLNDEVQKIKAQGVAEGLRNEVQRVEKEIKDMETMLFELKNRHRHLLNQVRELESSKDSKLSSYSEALTLNENNIKHFLRQLPVSQSLGVGPDRGMYDLKPERRTLQMAQEQWTGDLEMLHSRKAEVENERTALEEGGKLWREVTHRIRGFEKDVKMQTTRLSQSQGWLDAEEGVTVTPQGEEARVGMIGSSLNGLIDFLGDALAQAERRGWRLLTCAIGAELLAFQEASDVLQYGTELANGHADSGSKSLAHDGEEDDEPHKDLLSGGFEQTDADDHGIGTGTRSPGEESNHSLEDTLREFGNAPDMGKPQQKDDNGLSVARGPGGYGTGVAADMKTGNGTDSGRQAASKDVPLRGHTSESEDDDPGPEFLLSQT
ncbi:hypothetical protein LTR99_002508 [Exophiala xenobiotica]|uniref:Autophagy-related protein 28 n=1 Tax=Vermiconidia calcicola TaxID=1690605 RepID=A0AAV9QFL0_9PEZI|nr:hypothetical protein LTR72_003610 [Exophiala xenobiotica]KAK5537220.1 hypothetical protein LTR23_007608 [Chaetothyriales sp. CCFEE 6169]KAK5542154.1 hypothetical protein LTR25_002039 [Vermiconidia calcicola]KAK5273115.1 hypothetical protein LTR96_002747 [Exophiala xenobiotica]KAK5298527.1 hypothetical protein LTR14_002378 [Exophiala xenobiotica]